MKQRFDRRRSLLLGLGVLVGTSLLAGCGGDKLDALGRQRWAQAWLAALNSQRWEQVGPLLAADATYVDPLAPGVLSPYYAALHLNRLWSSQARLQFAVRHVAGDGSTVLVEWTAHGIDGDAARQLDGAAVLEVREHRLWRVRTYFNPASIRLLAPRRGS